MWVNAGTIAHRLHIVPVGLVGLCIRSKINPILHRRINTAGITTIYSRCHAVGISYHATGIAVNVMPVGLISLKTWNQINSILCRQIDATIVGS